jgi:hypothetical protein
MDLNELNRVLKYSHQDAAILLKQLATDPEHLKPGSNLRLIAADAHEEAGDKEFADYLRSSYPLHLDDNGRVLRSTLRLTRLLTEIHNRHHHTLTAAPLPDPRRRLNDPLNEETAKELEKNGREHEAAILRSEVPTRFAEGHVQANFPAYAWPGGNQIIYTMMDGGYLCPECRNGRNGSLAAHTPQHDRQWQVSGSWLHDEGPPIYCDHCNKQLVATYGDPDDPEGE